MTDAPLQFRWDGDAMRPIGPYWARKADAAYVVGQVYALAEVQERSSASHRHYFAAIYDAWLSLPEHEADRFPTSEHLRKWCLIKAGYSTNRQIACSSKAEAQRIAAFVRPMDTYAVVIVRDAVVTVFEAQSQSVRAMGPKEFQASKQAVLDILSGMIGVEPATLAANAGRAA